MSVSSISGLSTLTTQNSQLDPAKMIESMTKKLFADKDSDSDGYLTSSDLSGLSTDAFNSLDTDGDGKLSTEEVTSALKTQADAMKKAMESGDTSAMESLKSTAAGQLMEAARPKGPQGPPPPKSADDMASEAITNNDTDGDGSLSSSELSGLSSESFSKLDTDGDGKLSQAELQAAIQTQTDSMKSIMESDDSEETKQQKLDALKNTAEGQLMQTLMKQADNGPFVLDTNA